MAKFSNPPPKPSGKVAPTGNKKPGGGFSRVPTPKGGLKGKK